jgi:hypothetical protein
VVARPTPDSSKSIYTKICFIVDRTPLTSEPKFSRYSLGRRKLRAIKTT